MVVIVDGRPVALVAYAAWTNGTWSAATRHAGMCAVIGGAAFGTWLGLQAAAACSARHRRGRRCRRREPRRCSSATCLAGTPASALAPDLEAPVELAYAV